MRKFILSLLPALGMILTACVPVIPPVYQLELPALPPAWEEILGPSQWRVEWLGPDGQVRRVEAAAAGLPAIELAPERTCPVLAHPFWPDRAIPPGIMRPAGAIFPFDAAEARLILSWSGGVEAHFYRALNIAVQATGEAGAGELPEKNRLRQGEYFDWPRFRELMDGGNLPANVQEDPWLVDWQPAAERTVQSGFDRRRLTVQPREDLLIPIPSEGPWIGTSPFADALLWRAGETVTVGVTGTTDTYISPAGILHCTRKTWTWIPGS